MSLRRGGRRGLVVLSLLLLLTLVGWVTGASLWLTRAELWAAGRARAESQAAYTAAAGLRHAVAVLAADVDWHALEALSPAALADPQRPGPWAIGNGGWVDFPGPPFGYGVRLVESSEVWGQAQTIGVQSRATAARGASLVIGGTLARASRVYAPAALVLAGGGLEIEPGAGDLPAGVELLGAPPMGALGAASRSEEAAALRAVEQGGVHLVGATLGTVRMFDVGRFVRRSALAEVDPGSASLPVGSSGFPGALWVAPGVLPGLLGTGVVVVDGDLDVVGRIDFAGVLLVAGRLRLAGESCRIAGMVWARAVSFATPCRLEADFASVAAVDRVFRLPRLPILTAFLRD